MFTAGTDAIFEGLEMAGKSTRKLLLRLFFLPRYGIDVAGKVESSQKTGKSKPHICIRKESARANPMKQRIVRKSVHGDRSWVTSLTFFRTQKLRN